jgi:hypothetical protein
MSVSAERRSCSNYYLIRPKYQLCKVGACVHFSAFFFPFWRA